MKRTLLLTAGAGGVLAIVGGVLGIPFLIAVGAGGMVVSLILLGWVRDPDGESGSAGIGTSDELP